MCKKQFLASVFIPLLEAWAVLATLEFALAALVLLLVWMPFLTTMLSVSFEPTTCMEVLE